MKTSVLVPIFKEKRDIRNCNAYREAKLLEHAMKIVENVLARRIRKLVNVDAKQLGFMPRREITNALFAEKITLYREKYKDNVV